MPTRERLLEERIRPLYAYYQNELPTADPVALGTAMQDRLLEPMRGFAAEGSIALCGAELWYQLVNLCYQLLVRSGAVGGLEVATLLARQVPDVLASSLSLGDRMSVYDMLRHLFFMAGRDFADYRPFDDTVVRPYSAWLRAIAVPPAAAAPRGKAASDRRLRIGYLCNYPGMMAPGRVLAPLFLSMILEHQELVRDHDLIVYTVGEQHPAWRAQMAGFGITATPLPFTGFAARGDCGLPQALAVMRAGNLDLVLTDDNTAVPAYLFENRVAPVQTYMMMGMPFWGLDQLDFIILGSNALEACPDLPVERKLRGRYGYNPRLLDAGVDPAAVAKVRAQIPPGHLIGGTFSRFVRVTPEFLAAIGRILEQNPDFTMVIGGNGDPGRIRDFIAACPQRDRVVFFDHDVDVLAYGQVIDVLLDTTPIGGGNICREMMYFGRPVVSVQHPEFAAYFAQLRDPELVAADLDDYVGIVGRLIRDPAYLRARSDKAREIGRSETRPGNHAALLRELIGRVTA